MTKRISYYSCCLLLSCLVMISCKKLDDINHDPTKPVTTQPQYLLINAEKSAMDALFLGTTNGRIGTHFAQYWSANDKANDSRYLLSDLNNQVIWNTLYATPLHSLDEIARLNRATPAPASPNQIAISHILKAWLFQVLADTYGNIPYSEALKGTENIRPKYDDAKTVYNSLLDTLKAQLSQIDPAQPGFPSGDNIFNGNVDAWKKLGYSLMLRLAIRMADADPARAKAIIEAYYKNAMTGNADNAQFKYVAAAPNKFPYNDSEREQVEFFVSATLVNYMKSVNDPRLPVYARPPRDTSEITGMPYGTSESNPTRLPAGYYSYPGVKIYAADAAAQLMTYPEVEFILAEAAARGWATGDAATHYENGVKASLEYWGITNADTVDMYLKKVPYDAADWKNVIGTQKWLALYPQGFQGWFERLRLDFKKPGGDSLFITPVDGSLDPNVKFVPLRLTYPSREQTQNSANYKSAADAIGGDTKATKLWWNKN